MRLHNVWNTFTTKQSNEQFRYLELCSITLTFADIKTDGTVLNIRKVPISYSQSKFLARLQNESGPNDGNRTAISLPRIAFELTGFEYDQSRQQNKLFRNTKTTQETDKVNRKFQYAPAPYNLNFTLSVMANKMNDALQIVEQILPYFQPDYTVTMKMIDDMSDNRDVPVILQSVSFEDTYQGGFDERRVITYDLEFQMQLYFFGQFIKVRLLKTLSKEIISVTVTQDSQLLKSLTQD